MTFLRLAGCNAPELGLGCVRWCDTPGSWDPDAGEALSPSAAVAQAHFARICLTGGEPLLQAEGVAELVAEAHRRGGRVHLETNGTVPPPSGALEGGAAVFDWVVVSPKPPEYRIAPEWAGIIDELKLVVDEHLDAARAERLAAAHSEAIISVQPAWEGPQAGEPAGAAAPAAPGGVAESGASTVARAVRLVMEHPDWRLSLQTHKVLGIR
jgi:organic radical activating enzyme